MSNKAQPLDGDNANINYLGFFDWRLIADKVSPGMSEYHLIIFDDWQIEHAAWSYAIADELDSEDSDAK